jgi:predicted DNA-binding transcriptional regulator YafY
MQVDKKRPHELARLAQENRAVVILYHRGSQPGTKRQILPVSASGNRVRARDLASDEVKIFSLDKSKLWLTIT